MFCFLKMLVKKIETSHFLRAIFIFGCQILLFSCLYAKTLYYYEPPCLLNISITNERIYKLFFSPENWDPYANFEYKIIFVWHLRAEIIVKQNWVLKHINSLSYCHIIIPTASKWPLAALTDLLTDTDQPWQPPSVPEKPYIASWKNCF